MEKHLKRDHVAGLVAVYDACGGSIYAHMPLPMIRRRFVEPYRNEAKRIVEDLVRKGYVTLHKGRNISYSITKAGVEKLRELGIITRS